MGPNGGSVAMDSGVIFPSWWIVRQKSAIATLCVLCDWNIPPMNEVTLKTPIPLCRLYWSFLFGVVKQFCRFWIWSETECKTPAEYGPQYISTPPTPTPHSHALSVYTVHKEGGEGGGGQREGTVEGQQYTSIVLCPWGQQFTSWVENTNYEWIYLQSIKSVKQIAAKFVNRSTERKADI